MNPLELPGPEFLTFYGIAVVAALSAGWALRWLLRRPADESESTLSPCEVAYLAAGKKLAIQSALARLVHEKCLALDSKTGELTAQAALPGDATALERMLYGKVNAAAPGSRIRISDADTDQTDVVHRHLQDQGLLVSESQAALIRLAPVLVMTAVLLVGITKLAIGVQRDKPVGFLIAILAGAGLTTLVFLWPPFRSRRGDLLLAKLRQEKKELQASVQDHPEEMAGADLSLALGLFGVGVLTHTSMLGLRDGLAPQRRAADGGGGSDGGGGGCGDGGGGGCGGGGGGGCGGGCGGCGGGG